MAFHNLFQYIIFFSNESVCDCNTFFYSLAFFILERVGIYECKRNGTQAVGGDWVGVLGLCGCGLPVCACLVVRPCPWLSSACLLPWVDCGLAGCCLLLPCWSWAEVIWYDMVQWEPSTPPESGNGEQHRGYYGGFQAEMGLNGSKRGNVGNKYTISRRRETEGRPPDSKPPPLITAQNNLNQPPK